MFRTKRDERLPTAIAIHGGLIAALAVLLVGLTQGTRAWILLAKAGMAFLLSSALLKLLSVGVMQGLTHKTDVRSRETRSDQILDETAAVAPDSAASLPIPEKVAS